MIGFSENFILGAFGTAVLFMTGFVLPLLIRKSAKENSKQHEEAVAQRDEGAVERQQQLDILSKINRKLDTMGRNVRLTRKDVTTLQRQRLEDKQEFLDLYERVLKYDSKS